MRSMILWTWVILLCAVIPVNAGPNQIVFRQSESNAEQGEDDFDDSKADLPRATIYILNNANRTLRFALREDDNDWRNFRLGAGKGGFAQSPRPDVGGFSLRIRTRNQSVTSALEFHRRYRLYWNSNDNRWDVAEIAPR